MPTELTAHIARIVGEYHFPNPDAASDGIDKQGFDVLVMCCEEFGVGSGERAEDGDVPASCGFAEEVQ